MTRTLHDLKVGDKVAMVCHGQTRPGRQVCRVAKKTRKYIYTVDDADHMDMWNIGNGEWAHHDDRAWYAAVSYIMPIDNDEESKIVEEVGRWHLMQRIHGANLDNCQTSTLREMVSALDRDIKTKETK